MSNPLYSALNRNVQPVNDGGFGQIIQQLQSYRNAFRGDPRSEVQRLLDTGAMSQVQFNQLAQMANQLIGLMR